ncbi:hypothetical protein AB0L63_32520 [Nocardia sp. NPDC051990]|uniref:hypothetical protein n=1 Tax=Nocardia sp. NPDC051990 TaxID=3155285 RepID=UPI0034145AE5
MGVSWPRSTDEDSRERDTQWNGGAMLAWRNNGVRAEPIRTIGAVGIRMSGSIRRACDL